jgi:hypothetical protein
MNAYPITLEQKFSNFDNYIHQEDGINLQYDDINGTEWGNETGFLNTLLYGLALKEQQEVILFFHELTAGTVMIDERSLKNIVKCRLTKQYLNSITFNLNNKDLENAAYRAYVTRLEAIFLVLVARHILLREGAMDVILSSDVFEERFGHLVEEILKTDEVHDTVDNFKKFMLPLLALESKGIATGFYNRKDGLILEVCTIYENSGKKYVTGGGPSHATKRRQAARDLITGNNRATRTSKKRKSPSSSFSSSEIVRKTSKKMKITNVSSKKKQVESDFYLDYATLEYLQDDEDFSDDDASFCASLSSLSSPEFSSSSTDRSLSDMDGIDFDLDDSLDVLELLL